MNAIITLTTDFGFTDAYVAAMKGVILSINPKVTLVDISHSIKPQNILQAAFVLSTAYPFFPKETTHLVVVDPGVGTERKAIILETSLAYFVAPDNGVLSYVIQQTSPKSKEGKLGPEVEATALTKPEFWRATVSTTFHGRDIFAPVAALLSLGFTPTDFGETINSVIMLPLSHPRRTPEGVVGNIIHIDNFGNLITNISGHDLFETSHEITIEVCNQLISGLSRTYAEGKGLTALIGSSGYLEIALAENSASAFTGADVGDELKIRWQKG